MRQLYSTTLLILFWAFSWSQSNVTVNVTDNSSGLDLQGVQVTLDGNTLTTDASGNAVFTALADGS